jgi:hypothetical protein
MKTVLFKTLLFRVVQGRQIIFILLSGQMLQCHQIHDTFVSGTQTTQRLQRKTPCRLRISWAVQPNNPGIYWDLPALTTRFERSYSDRVQKMKITRSVTELKQRRVWKWLCYRASGRKSVAAVENLPKTVDCWRKNSLECVLHVFRRLLLAK